MPRRNIRTSQLVVPFGIGQIINFPNDESLMLGGMHLWDQQFKYAGDDRDNYDLTKFIIKESRLQKLLNVNHFRKPFPFLEKNKINKNISMPAVRFPGWHYCLKCGKMRNIGLIQPDFSCSSECDGKLIPVRFIAVCQLGHIQDVPFKEWVHKGKNFDENCILKYNAKSGAGDLASIKISCSCGAWRSLAGIMNEHALAKIGLAIGEELDMTKRNPNGQYCRGERPWLGSEGIITPVKCNQELRVLIRGASNVHYSHIVSAIFLPRGINLNPVTSRIIDEYGIDNLVEDLNQDNGDGQFLRAILRRRPEVINGLIELEKLYIEIISYIEDSNENNVKVDTEIDVLQLKKEEYDVLKNGINVENYDLKAVLKEINSYKGADFIGKYFDCISLIEKLKETRVFTGFSRINSIDGRTIENRKSDLTLGEVIWLPAMQVFGEGIFLKFKDEVIDEWLKKIGSSFDSLINRYREARDGVNRDRDINPAFLMMHTFAHLIIKRLCFSCGYGSSALRERIYFSSEKETRMNGIIIYTSSGDSEGSMGGLVRQGKEQFLSKNIKDALLDAEWCSADPVCSDIGRSAGQGPDSVNGAACHNCVIVPETSCEEYNCLLDRATVITLNDSNIQGFFDISNF